MTYYDIEYKSSQRVKVCWECGKEIQIGHIYAVIDGHVYCVSDSRKVLQEDIPKKVEISE